MTLTEYNRFCRTLPATSHVVQWGGSHVWKVGGKVFAIGSVEARNAHVTFKVNDIAWEMLREKPGLRPAPYLASRGLTWIQRTDNRTLGDAELEDYLRASYALIVAALPRKAQRELEPDRK